MTPSILSQIQRIGLIVPSLLLLGSAPLLQAEEAPVKPLVWMMPSGHDNGKAVRELFEKPDQWKETRSMVNVIGCADHWLNKQFSDEELKAWLPKLQEWNLKLGLEVGAIKPWGVTGEKVFNAQKPKWERIERLGGKIYAIAMDEPLCCTRFHIHKPDEYAVQETANFIALVRQQFPQILIGDIEPYPTVSLTELLAWIDALQAKLKEMNVRGLDFFRVDVDWCHFTIASPKHPGGWPEVKKLEQACRQRKLPFSLIYWAAQYPHFQKLNLADDSTWYVGMTQQGYDYAYVGGKPDEYVLQSWVGAPSSALPETGDWTFTRSVRDFCKRFIKPTP